MGTLLTPLDLIIFFGSLLAIMAIGLWAGRKEETSADFYLAGRQTRWWGVAGSIFGSNISANHMVGMMGVGFGIGFVESHFELGAIAGLLLLCYVFLPVYRKLNIYTLSEYLSRRYDDRSRVLYTVIMVVIITAIFMVPGFYIGSRSLNILLLDDADIQAALAAGDKVRVDYSAYVVGILIMAVVTGTYTIVGGLKAVIMTDVIQSVLMLIAGVIVAWLTFQHPDVGGWSGMMALDAARGAQAKMHLYPPSNHPDRPWTGMLTGLMVLHFYYWGTNQFIVQRALAARSDTEARLGIITAGFFKLLVPFISIGTGVAAFYLFEERFPKLDGDIAFSMLMREVVAPIGAGVVGIVAAGLVGAILSSLDSMMNSAATLITFDIYQRYVNPEADEKKLIRFGRICIGVLVVGAAILTTFIMDPNTDENFFTYVASHQSRLVAGILVAFAVGMIWKRATPMGGLAAILGGIVFSYGFPPIYKHMIGTHEGVAALFGTELNFFHTVFLAAIFSTIVHVVVSLLTKPDEEKSRLTWTELGGHAPQDIKRLLLGVGLALLGYAILAVLMVKTVLSPAMAAWIGAVFTFAIFAVSAIRSASGAPQRKVAPDRFLAGLLAALAIFMMFYFY